MAKAQTVAQKKAAKEAAAKKAAAKAAADDRKAKEAEAKKKAADEANEAKAAKKAAAEEKAKVGHANTTLTVGGKAVSVVDGKAIKSDLTKKIGPKKDADEEE